MEIELIFGSCTTVPAVAPVVIVLDDKHHNTVVLKGSFWKLFSSLKSFVVNNIKVTDKKNTDKTYHLVARGLADCAVDRPIDALKIPAAVVPLAAVRPAVDSLAVMVRIGKAAGIVHKAAE